MQSPDSFQIDQQTQEDHCLQGIDVHFVDLKESSHQLQPLSHKKQHQPFAQTSHQSNWSSQSNSSPRGKFSISIRKKRSQFDSLSPKKIGLAVTPKQAIFTSNQLSKTVKRTKDLNDIKIERIFHSPDLYQRQRHVCHFLQLQRTKMGSTWSEMVPKITASGCAALFTDNNEVIFESNGEERREMASLTKIMTAYTVIRICNSFGVKIRQTYITIHKLASYMEGTSANLRQDQELLVIDLLYGLLLPSGNDAAIALAQYFGKFLSFKYAKDQTNDTEDSIQKFTEFEKFYDQEYQRDSIKLFVFEMNKNAYQIGLKSTRFVNPTGLSHRLNYSTAKELAILTSHCLKNHTLRAIFKKKVYTCNAKNQKLGYNREVQWKNTNKHLYQFRECLGVKTGITPTAGPCLSSAYRINNRELVVILLNSITMEERYEDADKIYKWARKKLSGLI